MQLRSVPFTQPRPRTAARQPPDLEEVFARHADPVYRFLYSRVGNREDAEDLTSEVFLKASRQLDTRRAAASVTAWLFAVARTVLTDHWRRYYRAGTCIPLDDARTAEIPGALGEAGRSEKTTLPVAQLLAKLADRDRRVLELRFLHGYSIRDTAQELGVTPEHVKVIQHRALARAAHQADGQL